MASSQKDIDDLTTLIKRGGTEIIYKECKEKAMAGEYVYSTKKRIDRLTICNNSFDPKDTDAHWEILAHEATHIMQRCNGGTLLEDAYHPRIWRKLKAQAPHYVEILYKQYRDSEQMHEAEAYGMELQSPDLVKDWFVDFCLTKKKPSDLAKPPAEAKPSGDPAAAAPPTAICPPASAAQQGGSTPGTPSQRWMF